MVYNPNSALLLQNKVFKVLDRLSECYPDVTMETVFSGKPACRKGKLGQWLTDAAMLELSRVEMIT